MRLVRALSLASSVGLLPMALFAGWSAFLALVGFNFVVFHAIWVLPLAKGLKPSEEFFQAEMRLPLVLFMVAGTAAMFVIR